MHANGHEELMEAKGGGASDYLNLELQMVVSYHVHPRNWTWNSGRPTSALNPWHSSAAQKPQVWWHLKERCSLPYCSEGDCIQWMQVAVLCSLQAWGALFSMESLCTVLTMKNLRFPGALLLEEEHTLNQAEFPVSKPFLTFACFKLGRHREVKQALAPCSWRRLIL